MSRAVHRLLRTALAFLAIACASATAADRLYHLKGALNPPVRAVITLDGYSTTFHGDQVTDNGGHFEFKTLRAGTYMLIVAVPNRGELRRTLEVGPGSTDKHGVLVLHLTIDEAKLERQAAAQQGTVSLKALAIPKAAWKAWDRAQRYQGEGDAEKAIASLKQAVETAPNFSSAWNNLGTLYYKSAQYEKAEEAFRAALDAEPGSFEPLVNLGGVLLTLNDPVRAYDYNLRAVLQRPGDALANSQMGMNYYGLGQLELARKYLNEARHIDLGHFSHPQLLLAEICLRTGDKPGAIRELEEFLKYHPDAKGRARVEARIKLLKEALGEML